MKKENTIFYNSIKSYFMIAVLGLFAGMITRLTDFFPADTLWSFSSIATLFGFWILTVTLIICHSCSNINAGINTFLYLFMMSFSFYFLQYVLGVIFPLFDNNGFKYSLFMLYAIMSLMCGLIAFVLFFWNKNNKVSSILYALPVGGLFAETIGVGIYLLKHATFLFQFMFDFIGLLFLGWYFYKKSANKIIFMIVTALTAVLGYTFFYKPFL